MTIARRFTERLRTAVEWYVDQKNRARPCDQIDFLARRDERVSAYLSSEMRTLLASDPPEAGYRMPRVRFISDDGCGRPTCTRLSLRCTIDGKRNGTTARARVRLSRLRVGRVTEGELQHYPYRDLSEHLIEWTGTPRWRRGRCSKGETGNSTRAPAAASARRVSEKYNLQRRLRDGKAGLIHLARDSYYVMLKFAKLGNYSATRPCLNPRRHSASVEGLSTPGLLTVAGLRERGIGISSRAS